ncbi:MULTISPECIES: helix-turn-helix domain-containing protein [unclassified Streptomyces]|uniref:AfsR/SARP family transcriptional regulator n=1 Tax=unclassified Streptomyces TaxID=2593676 RepID=UPI002366C41E|nr:MULTISPECIES: helix-turn-helix domain-containing protein [unclassified Streptomyces]MDF3144728.1 helix-turn-helix domain-containing protein [Streptomyces sp. T21Q-yed]WDF44530.1 helix-turn-helix domain-containing protein [Streptomyces sp. T12]
MTIDQLAHRVWGDGPPQRATQTLYGYVSRLRRLLPGVITRRAGGYVLTADESMVDVHRFHRLLGLARQSADAGRSVALFQEALALWRGGTVRRRRHTLVQRRPRHPPQGTVGRRAGLHRPSLADR